MVETDSKIIKTVYPFTSYEEVADYTNHTTSTNSYSINWSYPISKLNDYYFYFGKSYDAPILTYCRLNVIDIPKIESDRSKVYIKVK